MWKQLLNRDFITDTVFLFACFCEFVVGDCALFSNCPYPNNHTKTILIPKMFGQWFIHISS